MNLSVLNSPAPTRRLRSLGCVERGLDFNSIVALTPHGAQRRHRSRSPLLLYGDNPTRRVTTRSQSRGRYMELGRGYNPSLTQEGQGQRGGVSLSPRRRERERGRSRSRARVGGQGQGRHAFTQDSGRQPRRQSPPRRVTRSQSRARNMENGGRVTRSQSRGRPMGLSGWQGQGRTPSESPLRQGPGRLSLPARRVEYRGYPTASATPDSLSSQNLSPVSEEAQERRGRVPPRSMGRCLEVGRDRNITRTFSVAQRRRQSPNPLPRGSSSRASGSVSRSRSSPDNLQILQQMSSIANRLVEEKKREASVSGTDSGRIAERLAQFVMIQTPSRSQKSSEELARGLKRSAPLSVPPTTGKGNKKRKLAGTSQSNDESTKESNSSSPSLAKKNKNKNKSNMARRLPTGTGIVTVASPHVSACYSSSSSDTQDTSSTSHSRALIDSNENDGISQLLNDLVGPPAEQRNATAASPTTEIVTGTIAQVEEQHTPGSDPENYEDASEVSPTPGSANQEADLNELTGNRPRSSFIGGMMSKCLIS